MAVKKPAKKVAKVSKAPTKKSGKKEPIKLAFIGGSGLYQIEAFEKTGELSLNTPWGKPSDKIVIGKIDGQPVAFLPRHAKHHTLLPSEVPYAANIAALKSLGVETIISVSACGSMREHIAPGRLSIPHQFVDWTKGSRRTTFFGDGCVGHIPMSDPACRTTAAFLEACVRQTGETPIAGVTYICIEGPRFSTRAESHIFRQLGVDIIGMTNCPEVFLAREAGIGYSTLALVTDFDCWNEEHDSVDVETVLSTIKANVSRAQKVIVKIAQNYKDFQPNADLKTLGSNSIQTAKGFSSTAAKKRLAAIGISM